MGKVEKIWRAEQEEDEREEELPSLVASIHEGEIITALMAIENLRGWM